MVKHIALSFLGASIITFVNAPVLVGATGQPHNPAGNNGVIKINNEVTPDDIPQNHPHVGCTFGVDFYNYDKGNYNASVNFALQAPTSGPDYTLTVKSGNLTPFIGGDAAGGGTDLDASQKYTLAFTGTPHDKQGYHVKVTVHAPGSQGSDKKQKVFWVQPCAENKPTSTPPAVLSTSTTTPSAPEYLPVTGGSALSAIALGLGAGITAYLLRLRLLKRS